MRTTLWMSGLVVVLASVAHSALLVATQAQQQPTALVSTSEDSLKRFLQNYLRKPVSGDDETARYSPAFVDLNGDGTQEVIVYVSGRRWCGTGGCVTLILSEQDSSYSVVTRITITRPPVRVLQDASKGWRSIAVWVQGGGIQPGYEAELRFNGKTYPSNPSVPPARRLPGKVAGEIVVPSSQKGMPLYP
jgi:hypothetical protein